MRGVHGGNPGAGQDAQDQGADTAKVREKESTATVLIQHGSEKCRYTLYQNICHTFLVIKCRTTVVRTMSMLGAAQ